MKINNSKLAVIFETLMKKTEEKYDLCSGSRETVKF